MDFVFMLTRNDATVENALDLVEIARELGLSHIGFKDVGAEAAALRRLTAAIRAAGATPWMEVVSTTREAELRSVSLGRDLGVDVLMGGVHVEEALKILDGCAIRYLPFAGKPSGHPTRLGGLGAGGRGPVPGLRETRLRGRRHPRLPRDRSRAARPCRRLPARVPRLRRGRGCRIGQFGRTRRALRAAGADAFTIGTAAIECVLRSRSWTANGPAQGRSRGLRFERTGAIEAPGKR